MNQNYVIYQSERNMDIEIDRLKRIFGIVDDTLSLEDRYTKAMELAGYKVIDMDNSDVTSISFSNASRTKLQFSGWQHVGSYLENMIITENMDAKKIEALIHPENSLQFWR